jgi:hypothetical protein
MAQHVQAATICCPSCGKRLQIPLIEGITLRWNSITCSNPNCRATIAVHVVNSALYFKWERKQEALIEKTPWTRLTQLQEQLQVI